MSEHVFTPPKNTQTNCSQSKVYGAAFLAQTGL